MADEILPANCLLDRKRLASIEVKQDQTLAKLENLVSIDGPIGKLREEIIINRQMTEAAHKRIDAHDTVLERIGGRQWQIILKTLGATIGGGGTLFVLVKAIEAFAGK